MKPGAAIGSLAKLVVVIGIAYAVINWKDLRLGEDDLQAFAERACVDEIRKRYDVMRVNPYSFAENSNGYVVRATATLNRGGNAKVSCLTDSHGGIRDIVITE